MKTSCIVAVALLLFLPMGCSAQSLRARVIENHYAYLSSDQERLPTLIAIPGCSGVSSENPLVETSNLQLSEDDHLFRRHYRRMGERLKDNGFNVLLLNIHRAEGLLTACAGEISNDRISDYINESIIWAKNLPFVDGKNLHLIGWSMGGGGVLHWRHGPENGTSGVRSVIAVYPDCSGLTDLTVSTPTLILLGASDDIADPAVCERLAGSITDRDNLEIKSYLRARHGFDISDAPTVLDIGNGMTVGYQKEAADASWLAIVQFLNIQVDRTNHRR